MLILHQACCWGVTCGIFIETGRETVLEQPAQVRTSWVLDQAMLRTNPCLISESLILGFWINPNQSSNILIH